MATSASGNESVIAPELYFLIAKFLASGPCQEAARVLKQELETVKVLPPRLDWKGREFDQPFQELERKFPHITPDHLLRICARIGPVLEKEVPPCIPGAISLLGAGRQSLLRTHEDLARQRRNILDYSGRFGGKSFLEPPDIPSVHSIVRVLQGRENSGPLTRREAVATNFYSKMQLHRHTLGHLSAVYCVLFDRTGQYVITGADDLLVKVWSAIDGRLLATFRGASSEIMDIAVNFDNTLLAAGSIDRVLRVWCFQTMSPVAVLTGHSGMITSVNFCPLTFNNVCYLVSTSTDGSVAFWSHTKKPNERAVFQPKPIQFLERMRPGQAQMICASFSPGGAFIAAGSADHHVRVYAMSEAEGPRRVLEVEAHTDTVDSIQWAHFGLKFISGSKDGTANVWHFERQQWQHKQLLMTTKLPGEPEAEEQDTNRTNRSPKVTMVCWDVSDEYVITAVNDYSLKVWVAKTGKLIRVLRAHKDEVFVMESHPIDPRLILSAGHDGQIIIWDVLNTEPIACFQNFVEGQGNCAVFDAKWSPDGTMLVATDSNGHLMLYGFGPGVEKLKIIPKELFFHTDYRPLLRDINNCVLDEQTQIAPHLMPPPFLVDVDGNPYPPALQRLVPGRENCRGEQLVPNIAVGAGGMQEVIEGLPEQEAPRSNIDQLIEALAQRQNINADGEAVGEDRGENVIEQPIRQIASPRGSRAGLRREGNVEGVRQSSGNWQRDSNTPWNKFILARPMSEAVREFQTKLIYAMAEMELECWRREMRRRPQPTTDTDQSNTRNKLINRRRNRTVRHNYRTRAARDEEQENEEFENENATSASTSAVSTNSNDSTAHEEDMSTDTTTADSSTEYSDWMADHGLNLEPPKRSKRKPVKKRSVTPPSDSDRRRSSRRPKKKEIQILNGIREVPELYRPPEWLTEVIPRKAPYYPQMGDEIVYFRQGHKFYLDAIRNKKVYELNLRCEPWTKIDLRAQEFVKVVGIKYEIRPPRLCRLKLALMDENGLTGQNFTIKYHDMADVLDFLVLRQTFDTALARSWSEGDKFRCMIDDGWWMGQIVGIEPLDEEFPDSLFMCFRVRWDNGEYEKMSPWDLEPIDEERYPVEVGGAVPVLPEERQAILYQPHAEEWPMGDRDATCRRIIRGLDQVMSLAIAEPFVVPVDLSLYPTYAYIVEYPIDLSTIKARFENHFYRRITSAQFDVRYLAANAEQFNEPHSHIVKKARIVTDLCLRIIKETTDVDVPAVYHQLNDTYQSSESEIDVEDKPSTSKQKSTLNKNLQEIPQDWKLACRQLLETLWQVEDSIPFREPVDRFEHPDYHQIIDTPMDLRTVKEDLLGGNYETPAEFAKDMRLIFSNSRNYNTNKRSPIYSMTVRLSAMFEEHMRKIISSWNYRKRNNNNNCNAKPTAKRKGKGKQKQRKKPKLSNGTGPKSKSAPSDDDDDDMNSEDDDDEESGKEYKQNNSVIDAPGPSGLTNGHTKRSSSGTTRSPLKLRICRTTVSKKMKDSDSEDSESELSDSDSSNSAPVAPVRRTRARTVASNVSADTDSGDDYTPGSRSKQVRKNRGKNIKNGANLRKQSKPKVKPNASDDDEESITEERANEEDEEQFVEAESTEEESEVETIIKRDTRSRKLVTETEENQKDTDKNGKNDNTDNESAEEEDKEEEQDEDEEEEEEEEEEDDMEQAEQSKHKVNNQDSDSDYSYRTSSLRPRRQNQRATADSENTRQYSSSRRFPGKKRVYYNEESDESMAAAAPPRNRRKIMRRSYAEESDESLPEPEPQPGISISSRGRIRKMTPRARAYLLESP